MTQCVSATNNSASKLTVVKWRISLWGKDAVLMLTRHLAALSLADFTPYATQHMMLDLTTKALIHPSDELKFYGYQTRWQMRYYCIVSIVILRTPTIFPERWPFLARRIPYDSTSSKMQWTGYCKLKTTLHT